MDKKTGFKTNQMLCVPLVNHEGKAIGAIQVTITYLTRIYSLGVCVWA